MKHLVKNAFIRVQSFELFVYKQAWFRKRLKTDPLWSTGQSTSEWGQRAESRSIPRKTQKVLARTEVQRWNLDLWLGIEFHERPGGPRVFLGIPFIVVHCLPSPKRPKMKRIVFLYGSTNLTPLEPSSYFLVLSPSDRGNRDRSSISIQKNRTRLNLGFSKVLGFSKLFKVLSVFGTKGLTRPQRKTQDKVFPRESRSLLYTKWHPPPTTTFGGTCYSS